MMDRWHGDELELQAEHEEWMELRWDADADDFYEDEEE